MSWPAPHPGLVIRYSYLWEREAREGREEGTKDRPCAVIVVLLREGKAPVVRVLPITHTKPFDLKAALEIPSATKRRLGFDSERSWVVLDEANDFIWPGPDLRPAINGDPASAIYGVLPPGFMRVLRQRLLLRRGELLKRAVQRTE